MAIAFIFCSSHFKIIPAFSRIVLYSNVFVIEDIYMILSDKAILNVIRYNVKLTQGLYSFTCSFCRFNLMMPAISVTVAFESGTLAKITACFQLVIPKIPEQFFRFLRGCTAESLHAMLLRHGDRQLNHNSPFCRYIRYSETQI